jgi:DTW domain-containing protein YfiP
MARRIHCPHCQRPLALCYCAMLTPLPNAWPVRILQHASEARHALGTARIASLGLRDCQLLPADARPLPSGVLIYPGPQSQPLSALLGAAPQALIFLDATWRKSRRLLLESAELAALPRYHLENPPPSRYRIRREPNAHALSTLEAIVQALEWLEAAPGRHIRLLEVMDALVDEQIAHMGETTYQHNYGRD